MRGPQDFVGEGVHRSTGSFFFRLARDMAPRLVTLSGASTANVFLGQPFQTALVPASPGLPENPFSTELGEVERTEKDSGAYFLGF